MRYSLLLLGLFLFSNTWSQNTIGLTEYLPESQEGYTLIAPNQSTDVFLINNCGELVHSWETDFRPGLSCYLLENGNLLKTKKTNQTNFQGGGVGGGLEIIDWDGNVLWSYELSDSLQCQHHDVEYLPNGNILVIAWDSYTIDQQLEAGRVIPRPSLWEEKIVELQPDFDNGSAEIVWEWKAWDHLVQQSDASLANYGVVSEHPELIDINYSGVQNNSPDWLHFNSVDYNEELDQIILSVHHSSEIWIVDHSTTTEEAAGHTGGNSGKGGDLLYRWGNPIAYGQGTPMDQKLFKQHDAYWISDSLTHGGMIMLFNNQTYLPVEGSTVDVLELPLQADGSYTLANGEFLPEDFHWTYSAENVTDFYSQRISGAQRLTNGNTMICEGGNGRIFEVDIDGNLVWEYINPVAQGDILTQGDIPQGNNVFRSYRYPTYYPAFEGKDLQPQGFIEFGSDYACEIFSSLESEQLASQVKVYPNPVMNQLWIEGLLETSIEQIEIIDLHGRIVLSKNVESGIDELNLDVDYLENGMYMINLYLPEGVQTKKFIKL